MSGPPIPSAGGVAAGRQIELGGRSLRSHSARGVVINTSFQVGYASITLFRRLAVAAFLTASEFGVWGLLLTLFTTLAWLKQIGISDKYIQQEDDDQEVAFQRAFTLELSLSGILFLLAAVALPLYALLVYDEPSIIVPGFVLSLTLISSAFQTPIWIHYRSMRFIRQRVLEGVDPVLGSVVMIALAVAGYGYWALVVGALVGSVAGAVTAVLASPYRLHLRFDRGTLREYFAFSWPLAVLSGSTIVIVQGSVIVGDLALGLAGVGAIGLASSFAAFSDRVDTLITRTVYPAICAVADRTEVLKETFIKTNRVALMWGLPLGFGLGVFGGDLVTYVLGDQWTEAAPLIQAFGVIIGLRQIGFNWTAFMRARGETRPIAVGGVVAVIVFAVVTAPLMIVVGLNGYAIGMGAAVVADLIVRSHYLRRLFAGFSLSRVLVRAVGPLLPALAVVGAMRLAFPDAGAGLVVAEVLIYVLLVGLVTVASERTLLREMLGYLRARPARGEAGDAATAGP